MGCGRFTFTLIPLVLTLAALVLTCLGFVGMSANNSFLLKSYVIRYNLTDLKVAEIFPTIAELTDVSISNRDLGLSDYYACGLWNYCKGDANATGDIVYSYCSKPKAMFFFDPIAVLTEDLSNGTMSISTSEAITLLNDIEQAVNSTDSSINLPGNLQQDWHIYHELTKGVFVCYIIGIVFCAIQFVIGLFTCTYSCLCFIMVTGVVAIITLGFSTAATTAIYGIVSKALNNSDDTYGIKADLSIQFYAFVWVAFVAIVLGTILWIIVSCCISVTNFTRLRRQPVMVQPEQQPFMGYDYKE